VHSAGAVTTLGALRRSTVNLDQHGIVNVAAECAFGGLQIGLVAVAGKLDAIAKGLSYAGERLLVFGLAARVGPKSR